MLAIYVLPQQAHGWTEIFGVWAVVLILVALLSTEVSTSMAGMSPQFRKRVRLRLLAVGGGLAACAALFMVYISQWGDVVPWCWCWW